MFRHRVRPPTPPLDEVTAERLLGGAPPDDLPDAFRPLGQLLAAASGPPTEDELEGSAAAAAAFVAADEATRPSTRRRMSMASGVLAAAALVVSTGTAVAATQGALPEPMQQVAHETLKVVGISVPGITDKDEGGAGATHDDKPATTVGGLVTGLTPVVAATPGTNSAVVGDSTAIGTSSGGVAATPDGGNGGARGGNSGQGNDGNEGQGNGNGGGGALTDEPTSNLPPRSNGKGNGPPQVPPGRAEK